MRELKNKIFDVISFFGMCTIMYCYDLESEFIGIVGVIIISWIMRVACEMVIANCVFIWSSAIILYYNPALCMLVSLILMRGPFHHNRRLGMYVPGDMIWKQAVRWKGMLNNLTKSQFARIRFWQVDDKDESLSVLDPTALTRGSRKFRDLLKHIEMKDVERVVDLCAGSGGFSDELYKVKKVHIDAYSYWETKPGHNLWASEAPVERHWGDVHMAEPKACELIMFDGGEQMPDVVKEAERFDRLFEVPFNWVQRNPECQFVLKVLTPCYPEVRAKLIEIQRLTGKGKLVRLGKSRNSNLECYFVSSGIEEVDKFCESFIGRAITLLDEGRKRMVAGLGLDDTYQPDTEEYIPEKPYNHEGLEGLPRLDRIRNNRALNRVVRYWNIPRQKYKYLKELTWWRGAVQGSKGFLRNAFSLSIVKQAIPVLNLFKTYRMTDTTPEGIHAMIRKKVDTRPKEDHQYYPMLRKIYYELARKVRIGRGRLRRLDWQEIKERANKQGAPGQQENEYRDVGDYLERSNWISKVRVFEDELLHEESDLTVYNAMGKKERKQQFSAAPKASRLIWFLPMTARLSELRTFGYVMDLMKKLPFSVSGIPLFDYGERLKSMKRPEDVMVTEDIASWDTRISIGDMKLECWFLQLLHGHLENGEICIENDEHTAMIEQLYRVYAHKHVMVARSHYGQAETAIVEVEGQRGSGEVITYAMNTITNFCNIFCKYCVSNGIEDVRKEMDRYFSGKSGLRCVVSGDDSVVFLEQERAVKYAGFGQYNKDVGKPRKNIEEELPSPVLKDLKDINFCSNQYRPVQFGTKERWMPCRDVEEVIAKSTLMMRRPKDIRTEEAWARMEGFQLALTYPHIPDIRLYALALLSVTRSNIQFLEYGKSGRIKEEPWLDYKTLGEAVRHCYGERSQYPVDMDDIGKIKFLTEFSMRRGKIRKRWKGSLRQIVQDVKSYVMSRDPVGGREYEDVLQREEKLRWREMEYELASDRRFYYGNPREIMEERFGVVE